VAGVDPEGIPSLPFLVGLGAADIYDQARAVEVQVADVQAHQFRAAEGAGEAGHAAAGARAEPTGAGRTTRAVESAIGKHQHSTIFK